MNPHRIIFPFALLLILSTTAFSQLVTGTWLAGGNANASFLRSPSKAFSFGLSPTGLYFPVDRLAIGIRGGYSYSRQGGSGPTTWSSNFSMGPAVRYYYPLSEKAALFPLISYSLGKSVSQNLSFDQTTGQVTTKFSTDFRSLNGGVGLVYFVRENIGLEAILGYTRSTQGSEFVSKFIGLNFGLQFYLAKRK